MRLSTVIMAHRVREQAVAELQQALGSQVPVSWDCNRTPSPDPEQRWATGKRAWRMIDPDADYGMVIQDDVLVAKDLIAGIEKALTVLGPRGLVSAYTGTGRPDQKSVQRALNAARRHGSAWASTMSLNWGPAIIAPTSHIPAMLEWCSEPARKGQNYDYRIGVYFRDVVRWRTFYLVPSLVEHRGLPSLVGHDTGPERVAHEFIGTANSALSVNYAQMPAGGLSPSL